jgi:hypothetical protein
MSTSPSPSPSSPSRFALWRSPLAIGPVLFIIVFLYRSVTPFFDGIVTSISAGLIVVVAFMFAGHRWAGVAFAAFPIALFTSPAGREFSFNLSSVDDSIWRWHAIIGLLSLGVSSVAAVLVALGRVPRGPRLAASLAGGVAFGTLMIVAIDAMFPHPGFGRKLTSQTIASLPKIDMLNYAYDLPDLLVANGEGFIALVDNPSNLPHSLTIDSLGIDVYVPAGRYSILEITPEQLLGAEDGLHMYCTVGEHRMLGMERPLIVAPSNG